MKNPNTGNLPWSNNTDTDILPPCICCRNESISVGGGYCKCCIKEKLINSILEN